MECFIKVGQLQHCSLFSVCWADGTVADGNPYLCNPPTKLDFILWSQSGMNKSFSPVLSCRLIHVCQCNVGEIKQRLTTRDWALKWIEWRGFLDREKELFCPCLFKTQAHCGQEETSFMHLWPPCCGVCALEVFHKERMSDRQWDLVLVSVSLIRGIARSPSLQSLLKQTCGPPW